jgi:hypothetical protein
MATLDPRTAAAGGVLPKTKANLFNPTAVKHATLFLAFQQAYQALRDEYANDLLPIHDRLVVRAIFPAFKKIATAETGLLIARNIAAIYYASKQEAVQEIETSINEIKGIARAFNSRDKKQRADLRLYTADISKSVLDFVYNGTLPDASTDAKLLARTGLPLEVFNLVIQRALLLKILKQRQLS